MGERLLPAVAIAVAGCMESNSVTCDFGTCPEDTVCALVTSAGEEHGLCVMPDQLTACLGKSEGDACTISAGDFCANRVTLY